MSTKIIVSSYKLDQKAQVYATQPPDKWCSILPEEWKPCFGLGTGLEVPPPVSPLSVPPSLHCLFEGGFPMKGGVDLDIVPFHTYLHAHG